LQPKNSLPLYIVTWLLHRQDSAVMWQMRILLAGSGYVIGASITLSPLWTRCGTNMPMASIQLKVSAWLWLYRCSLYLLSSRLRCHLLYVYDLCFMCLFIAVVNCDAKQ